MRGTYTITITPKAGGDPTPGSGNWMAVYARQPDGNWKTICDIWVVDESVSAGAAGSLVSEVLAAPSSVGAKADIAAIKGEIDDWYAAYNAGDYEKLAALYAEDAVTIGEAPVVIAGRTAILESFQQEMEQYDLHIDEGNVEDVRVSGDLGMARGVDTGAATPKDGGDAVNFDTKWVSIYKRQADGSWLCICEIGNSNLPPADSF
jgi:uncharacterized protein (TIGR02246 family)